MSEDGAAPPTIGVVAIGRNEGDRLKRCLASLKGRRVVYVDSGSADGSVEAAKAAGAEVAILDTAEGFTAARARNLGAATLAKGGPVDFIQFVDGDCEVVEGWIEKAASRLSAEPKLAVVAGRRREIAPDATIFNRQCDMEWNTPVGEATAVGGDAMYRREAFDEVGGFDGSFICGEEPELCFRLRAAGWRIERMDEEMTRHDAAIDRWGQWRRRTQRSGWAAAEGAATHGASPERYYVRDDRSTLFWGGLVPAGTLGAALLAALAAAFGSPGAGPLAVLALLGVLAYVAMAVRVARWRERAFGDPPDHARLYGALTMLGKIPQFLGALDYRRHRRAGKEGRIIEYKGPEAAPPAG
ncbi:MAG: glycosyltransferase [Pseudomonadota bacterium]